MSRRVHKGISNVTNTELLFPIFSQVHEKSIRMNRRLLMEVRFFPYEKTKDWVIRNGFHAEQRGGNEVPPPDLQRDARLPQGMTVRGPFLPAV